MGHGKNVCQSKSRRSAVFIFPEESVTNIKKFYKIMTGFWEFSPAEALVHF